MKNSIPNHVAIIMDGNGRWATRQGKKRTDGHYAGYKRFTCYSELKSEL